MTAMSSRRTIVHEGLTPTKTNGNVIAVLATVAGLLVTALGIKVNIVPLMGIGFAAFCSGLMYLNAQFWCWMYETGKIRQSIRRTPPSGL